MLGTHDSKARKGSDSYFPDRDVRIRYGCAVTRHSNANGSSGRFACDRAPFAVLSGFPGSIPESLGPEHPQRNGCIGHKTCFAQADRPDLHSPLLAVSGLTKTRSE
jgi:hypothetical protein